MPPNWSWGIDQILAAVQAGTALVFGAATVYLGVVANRASKRSAEIAETMARIERDRARKYLQFASCDPIAPAAEGWYELRLANPTDNAISISFFGWTIWPDPQGGMDVRQGGDRPFFVDAEKGDPEAFAVGARRLKRVLNVGIPPGQLRGVYFQGNKDWQNYIVKAKLKIAGPGVEPLYVDTFLLTPKGAVWNFTRAGPCPPNPWADEQQRDARRAAGLDDDAPS